ncbi:MAG: T9SS type A sorting domain-containing protein [Candidatus Kapaibacterium sp.]|jgi:hypothetical protein
MKISRDGGYRLFGMRSIVCALFVLIAVGSWSSISGAMYRPDGGFSFPDQLLVATSSEGISCGSVDGNHEKEGLNNIHPGASTTIPLITGDAFQNHNLDIMNNYWGVGIDPQLLSDPNPTYYPGFHYNATAAASSLSSSSEIVCSAWNFTKMKNGKALQSQSFDTCSNAAALCEQWSSNGNYDAAFDTIRWAIIHCYPRADPAQTLGSELAGCAGRAKLLSSEAGRFQYRNWLLDTVLSLRSDDGWFCFAVGDLTATYYYQGIGMPAALAILKFLIDNPRCAGYRNEFASRYSHGRQSQIVIWQDTAKNADLKYFDSTLPSLHMLGLDTLLHYASVAHYDSPGPAIILDARITSNPFKGGTSVSLSIAREAYLHLEVLDLLGRKIEGAGYDGVFERGSRTIPLHLTSIAAGSYYLRISTANNELRTMKLEKLD